jgi:two-component system chemotaxis response regulator CheV
MSSELESGFALARAGEQLVGVEMARVLALLAFPDVTPLPRVPAACEGIMVWEGQAVPVYDLKKTLYLPASRDDKGQGVVLVARWRHALVGLHADEVLRVVDIPAFDPPSPSVSHVRGESMVDGRALYVLDLDSEFPGLP